MKHKDVMEDIAGNPKSNCDGELEYVGSDFSLDVYWIIYRCQKCGKEIWTVNGFRHWWNFEKEAKP